MSEHFGTVLFFVKGIWVSFTSSSKTEALGLWDGKASDQKWPMVLQAPKVTNIPSNTLWTLTQVSNCFSLHKELYVFVNYGSRCFFVFFLEAKNTKLLSGNRTDSLIMSGLWNGNLDSLLNETEKMERCSILLWREVFFINCNIIYGIYW